MVTPENIDQMLERFRRLRVWSRYGWRAPYKPLMILWAIGRCLRCEERMATFEQARAEVGALAARFGPYRRRNPSAVMHQPFWRLQNDGVWEIDRPNLVTVNSAGAAHISDLVQHKICGGLTEAYYHALRNDPQLAWRVAMNLLAAHFPESIHDHILDSVGIDEPIADPGVELVESLTFRRPRDPAFRRAVLVAYANRCAVCEMSLNVSGSVVALEAAHIRWHASGGSDEVRNGLALCVLHHKLFDLGAFTLLPDLRVFVSSKVEGRGADNALERYHRAHLLAHPNSDEKMPAPEYLCWHRREVFRSPYEIPSIA